MVVQCTRKEIDEMKEFIYEFEKEHININQLSVEGYIDELELGLARKLNKEGKNLEETERAAYILSHIICMGQFRACPNIRGEISEFSRLHAFDKPDTDHCLSSYVITTRPVALDIVPAFKPESHMKLISFNAEEINEMKELIYEFERTIYSLKDEFISVENYVRQLRDYVIKTYESDMALPGLVRKIEMIHFIISLGEFIHRTLEDGKVAITFCQPDTALCIGRYHKTRTNPQINIRYRKAGE